ncbi:MAG: protoporphyrinogen/coproporphyrinogen oxidase, partial [Acidimicrobiales bacterium]
MSADDRVVVVGGGLSGLLTGVELLRRGADVTVVEASGSPGGVAATVHEAGYVLEPAAGTLLLPHPHLSPILAAAGVPLVEAPAAARRRWVYRHGRLIEMRESPAMIASPVLSIAAKLRVLREPWIGRLDSIEDESLLSFAIRRLGTEAGELLATLMAHGVFAGDPASMSARASFPGLVALEDESSSVIRGAIGRIRRRPRGTRRPAAHHGPHAMSGVATALAAALGPRFRPAWPVTRVTRADDGWEVQGKEAIGAAAVIVALAPVAAAALVPTGLSDVL